MKIDIKKLNNLDKIIASYEAKTLADKSLSSSSTLAYKQLDGMQASLNQIENNQSTRKVLETQLSGINIVGDISELTDRVNQSFNSVNKSFSDINEKIETGANLPFDFLEAELNKINLGPLKDCLPCSLRGKGDLFNFQFNFQLLDYINKIIQVVQDLVNVILPRIDLVGETDICVMLNSINFKCLPDKISLSFMFQKSLDIKLKTPEFKLPALSDLILLLISPLYIGFSFSAESWLAMVLNPINCMIESMDKQIKALERNINSSNINIDTNFLLKAQTSLSKNFENKSALAVGITETLTPTGQTKIFKGAQSAISSLKKLRDEIKKNGDQLKVHFKNNFFDKTESILKSQIKGLDDFVKMLAEIKEVTQLLALLDLIFDSFSLVKFQCKKEENFAEELEKTINDEIEKIFPGNIKEVSPDEILNNQNDLKENNFNLGNLMLDEKEVEALNLNEVFVPVEAKDKAVNKGLQVLNIKRDRLKISSCINSNESSFYDTLVLEQAFS